MNLYAHIHQLLHQIGTGRILTTAYDTAWLARLGSMNSAVTTQALEWLRAHQLPDGSWGTISPHYNHDRLVCTLAAMTALAQYGDEQDAPRLWRAEQVLDSITRGLKADAVGETIGFEMIVPTLVHEAKSLGLLQHYRNGILHRLEEYRAAKLAALPGGMINRFVTVAFSAEMAGPDGQRLLDLENLQEANGSVAHSPSATAYYAINVCPGEPRALAYLSDVVNTQGGVPDVAPFDVFEQAWTLWNLSLTGPLDADTLALCQPHLDFLQRAWRPGQGVGFAAGYTPTDGDDTGLVFDVLTRFGRPADLDSVLRYEQDDYYRCYELEANPSISANIHVLSALREAGLPASHPSVQKVLGFLKRVQLQDRFWFDKWHASPYYPTSHLIIAGAGYAEHLVESGVAWLLETQRSDGSWGYYMPTAEETADCLQALVTWRRQGHSVPNDAIQRGADWLAVHAEPPYPPLWIGKCLYCPELVVRSAILSALTLVAQG